uniref:DUF148 domain-containing protein n=1 Tax=Parastrongyloides trichosuri TaxID=131310 RepID=A0A0N5A377_PARTI
MNVKYFLVVLCIVLLITFDLAEAGKKGGKKGKGNKAVEGKGGKVEKTKEPKIKAEKVKTEKVKGKKVKKTKKAEKEVVPEEEIKVEEVAEETHVETHVEEIVAESEPAAHLPTLQEKIASVKAAKQAKAITAYEQCKQDCRVKRDQLTAQEYVDKLKQELLDAEEYLASQPTPVIETISTVETTTSVPVLQKAKGEL